MTRLCPRCLIVVAEWLGLWKPVVPKLDVLQAMVDLADQRYGERIHVSTSDYSTEAAIQFVEWYARMIREKEFQQRRMATPMFTNCG